MDQGSLRTGASELCDCLFLDALDLDPRPTLIVDLESTQHCRDGGLQHAFYNDALKSRPALLKALQSKAINGVSSHDFYAWVTGVSGPEERKVPFTASTAFHGLSWIYFTLKNRWRVVCAITDHPASTVVTETSLPRSQSIPHDLTPKTDRGSLNKTPQLKTELNSSRLPQQSPELTSPKRQKWLALEPTLHVGQENTISRGTNAGGSRIVGSSSFVDLIRTYDWASTPLGPISSWPDRLVQLCNLILADPNPASLHWSSDLIIIYNEACLPTLAERHPALLGKASRDTYVEIWETYFEPLFTEVMTTGHSVTRHDNALSICKNGVLEETFFTTTFLPIFAPDGNTEGILELFSDVTKDNLLRRRTRTLLDINNYSEPVTTLNSLWKSIVQGVEGNSLDIPQLLVYAIPPPNDDSDTSPDQRLSERLDCVLQTSIGYKHVDLIAENLRSFDILSSTTAIAHYFRQAMSYDEPIVLRNMEDAGMADLWNSFEPRAFGEPPHEIVILSMKNPYNGAIIAFLLIGLNPRLVFDHEYALFIDLLRKNISSRVATIFLLEQEVQRRETVGEQAAAQLRIHIEEAAAHELRFTRFAQHAPIGICIYAPDGSMAYANDIWYSLTQFPRDADSTGSTWWSSLIFPEDIPYAQTMFGRLLLDNVPVSFEIRLNALSKSVPNSEEKQCTWVLCSAYPELSKDRLDSVVACFTDITEQKRHEEVQKQRLVDAIEAKRDQENFIDITSHEIRNPLSVVLQCGEEIIAACKDTLDCSSTDSISKGSEVAKDILDAAETIEYCTLYQKRIIDDILTLSKMDSGLLPIAPDKSQPLVITEGVLKAFKRELRMSEIEMGFRVDDSLERHKLDWYELDPSRYSQMIINLVSNAIKFTKTQSRRRIDVRIGITTEPKPHDTDSVVYLPRKTVKKDWTQGWSSARPVFLHLSVQDSGRGMDSEEQKALFTRFSQASPRTHIQYGGSGLGLYICRALTEMHGGQIGFSSKPNEGSTFGFYIKMWPCEPPQTSTPDGCIGQPAAMNGVSDSGSTRQNTKRHILIVEDNLLNQKVMRRQLEKLGHHITVAHHGEEAIEILQRTHFWRDSAEQLPLSVMLMDIEMPVMDGLTLARTIREHQTSGLVTSHIPLIAVTGNARKEKTDLAKNAGVDEVVLKPFTIPSLMPIIDKLCTQWNS
jgi:signal transduction histidine kinase/CheY-like chemotaxis protein